MFSILLRIISVKYVSAFALDVLDRRIRSQSDVASVVDEPVLATIPRSVEMTRRRYSEAPDHRVEEALRKLRTNLRYTNIDTPAAQAYANIAERLQGRDIPLMELDVGASWRFLAPIKRFFGLS